LIMVRVPILYLVFLLPLFLLNVQGSQTVSEQNAKQTVTRYLEAQRQGDTATMKSLIAGDLRKDKAPLLSNPSYPAYLSETFAHVDVAIDWAKALGPGKALVQASMTYRPGDIVTKRYVLHERAEEAEAPGAFLIHEEYDPDFR